MRKSLAFATVVPAVLALVWGASPLAQGSNHEPLDGGQAEEGRALYLENCASCHGAGAKGNGPMSTSLKVLPPDLTTIAARRGGQFNGAEMAEMIEGRRSVKSHGSREMPVWGNEFMRNRKRGEGPERAARTRVHALVTYLESIQVAAPKD